MGMRMKAVVAGAAMAAALTGEAALPAVTFEAGNVDVVVAPRAVDSVIWAADEATNFLSRVLGSPVPVVAAPRAGRTALVLGVNEWSKDAGLDPAKYPRDTYLIKTAPGKVFVAGIDEKGDVYRRLKKGNSLECFQRGTAFGVYAFLERFAGCRFYFPGELGEVVPRKRRFSVPKTNIVSTSANLVRKCYLRDGEISPEMQVPQGYNPKILNWMRLKLGSTSVPCCHGTRNFGFMERFATTHPEYFALGADGKRWNKATARSSDGQLCFSHPDVRDIIYEECLKRFRSGEKFVDIMPNDGYPGCRCDRCEKLVDPEGGTYGRNTPVIWDYTADIARRLKKAGIAGKVTQMAYSSYSAVPDFDLPDNVAVMVATRGPWALADRETMKGDARKVRAWTEKTGGSVWLWTYPQKYKETCIPGIPDVAPKAWGRYYKLMDGMIFGTFAESESDRSIYHYLNYYVFSRVLWDMKTDINAVLDEHYHLMFGPAAGEMKSFYEMLEKAWTRGVVGNVIDSDFGPVVSMPTEGEIWTRVYSPESRRKMDALLAKAAAKVASGSIEARRIAFFRREYFDGLQVGAKAWQKMADAAAAQKWRPASGEKVSLTWYSGDEAGGERVKTTVAMRRDGDDYVLTFDCEEPRIDEMSASTRPHDHPGMWRDSGVGFRFLPDGDRMHWYYVVANARGCLLDMSGYKPGRTRWVGKSDSEWESGAKVAVTARTDGWTTEVRIPVATLGSPGQEIPIELMRTRSLKQNKDGGYYKWGRISDDIGNYEFYGTVELP